jgi:prepilin-type N-terminal cleavage/methylation domain-containing protein
MKSGFSLVELSIVLVILGLLTGGILGGQSLIRASELRTVSTEHGRYVAAVHSFRDKYFQLPGDLSNATNIWGTAANCPGNSTQGSTTSATCNGDGNGKIMNTGTSSERYRAWQHLANAGLIEGSFSGVAGAGGANESKIASNVPASKLGRAGWTIRTCCSATDETTTGNTAAFAGVYGNMFDFGAELATNTTQDPVLKPEELWNIDTKMDDGKPGTGRVLANYWSTCTLATSQSDIAANYNLASSAIGCGAFFVRAF